MMTNKKIITETELLARLERREVELPPLTVAEVHIGRGVAETALDALLTLRWQDRTFRFAVECSRLWTPKAISEAAVTIRRKARPPANYPLVLAPYLSEERLRDLEAEGVGGIDLCGNGVVAVPGEILVFRTGAPNRFRFASAIKNVYRRTSSVVSRVFLLVPEFASVQEALAEVKRRGGQVTLATVSKVCSGLVSDLIIERSKGETALARRLRLLQPEKLLDLLASNYEPPEVSRTFRGKFTGPPEELAARLARWDDGRRRRVVQTGASSAEAYAVMAREATRSYYCTDMDGVRAALGGELKETDRFPSMNLLETRDEFVYFDRRDGLVPSPIQTYLELVTGEKRERETAEQLCRAILGPLATTTRKG